MPLSTPQSSPQSSPRSSSWSSSWTGPAPRRVALFISCVGDLVAPRPARAAVEVLEAMGVRVEVPAAQTCCGQPALNSGHPDGARALMRHWLRVFAPYEAVVTPSGSCAAMVHHHVARLCDPGPAERDLVARTYEFSQFVAAFGADLDLRLDATATYHDSCHMARMLGERQAPRTVLKRIAGLRLTEMTDHDACCGFGGTFAAKFPDVSVAMADTKLGQARATGAELLVSADPGCLTHLRTRAEAAGRPVVTRHVAEVVRDALTRTEVTR